MFFGLWADDFYLPKILLPLEVNLINNRQIRTIAKGYVRKQT